MQPKIEINVTGKVLGFPYEDEDREQAIARLVLSAEMHGNESSQARLHLSIARPYQGSWKPTKTVKTEGTMHQPRDLRQMLFELPNTLDAESEEAIVLVVTHWLMNCQHERRVAQDLPAQQVIQTIIDRLK